MMTIEPPCVVSLSWKLTDAQNRAIDELTEPVEFFYGGSDLLAKVEEALAGHVAGERVKVQVEPEHAFGDYKAELVCFEDRLLFPEHVEPGMAFEGLPTGSVTPNMPADTIYLVTEVYPTHVVLDGNHPLAGMAIRLDILVHQVREASAEEAEAGSLGSAPVSFLSAGATLPPRRRRALTACSGRRRSSAARFHPRPVEPNPPSPRNVPANASTTRNCACTTGTMTICAMRSIGCTVNAVLLRFQQLTISGPW